MLVMNEAFDCWADGKNPDDYHKYFDEVSDATQYATPCCAVLQYRAKEMQRKHND
eukprot:SAG11_NODE_12778_length_685_cov_2.211604_1_plen_55_part_00